MPEPTPPKSQRPTLGKGLDSLLGGMASKSMEPALSSPKPGQSGQPMYVDPRKIKPNPQQPRSYFSKEQLEGLARSVKENGILQPLVVSWQKETHDYVLIAGERRLRASIAAGLQEVPVYIREADTEERLRLALLENIQRSDLSVIEEARAYDNLIKHYGLTQEACAQKLGKDRSSVANVLRMLTLPPMVQEDLIAERLSFGHGKILTGLSDKGQITALRELIVKRGLSVRQTEKLAKQMKKNKKLKGPEDPNRDLEYLADNLRQLLRTKVKFQGTGSRGRIEISYFSASELERLLQIMGADLS